MHRFQDISKNVFLIQQIFRCEQYGAHRPDSQQPNSSDDLSIDEHWPWPTPLLLHDMGKNKYACYSSPWVSAALWIKKRQGRKLQFLQQTLHIS